MRIAVLGVGLIGGSIGLAAKRRLGAEVVGYDAESANARRGERIFARKSSPKHRPYHGNVAGISAGLVLSNSRQNHVA